MERYWDKDLEDSWKAMMVKMETNGNYGFVRKVNKLDGRESLMGSVLVSYTRAGRGLTNIFLIMGNLYLGV